MKMLWNKLLLKSHGLFWAATGVDRHRHQECVDRHSRLDLKVNSSFGLFFSAFAPKLILISILVSLHKIPEKTQKKL